MGRSTVKRKFSPKDVKMAVAVNRHGKPVTVVSFEVDEVIVISLEDTFSVTFNLMTTKRQRDEIGDVKVYLMDGNEVVCRTQVTIWAGASARGSGYASCRPWH